METQQYEIECGRCGETRLEWLSADEARRLADATGPVWQQCEHCGRTTGWIRATSGTGAMNGQRRTPRGQERVATEAERNEVNRLLHQPDLRPSEAEQ
ncbi:MAG TPA: hypothetical protein VNQ79_03790 [Blastocatellia bacterium]|nr:hypothetical protein [Blastocatellia bacterium]